MLKITVLGLISIILNVGLSAVDFIRRDFEDDSTILIVISIVLDIFSLIIDFIVMFMLLGYILK